MEVRELLIKVWISRRRDTDNQRDRTEGDGEHEGRTREMPSTSVYLNLMDAVDAYIPKPERPIDKPFLMPIEDVFTISGRGTVVTGGWRGESVKVGEEVEIVGIEGDEEDSGDRSGDVQEAAGRGASRRQRRSAVEGNRRRKK